MTSEELEQSLKAEFENHHNKTIEAIRQDVADFQTQFEAEFSKHKAQLDEALKSLSERMFSERQLDKGFAESVVEHLRLARDEGAQITATAFGEAEKLRQESTPPAKYDLLRDAIEDISSQVTQAAILKSLVERASDFAPRGVFFIVKNDQFIGWKVFGSAGNTTDETAQAVRFPLSADTIVAKAALTLHTTEGAYGLSSDDDLFLTPLDLGRPDRMYAIPLTARGRGVAVLYADYGIEGVLLNKEALETLVRVAGLTVELRAAAPAQAAGVSQAAGQEAVSHVESTSESEVPAYEYTPAYEVPAQEPASHEDASPAEEAHHIEPEYVSETPASFVTETESEPTAYQPASTPFDAPAVPETDSGVGYQTNPSMGTEEPQQGAVPAAEVESTPQYGEFSFETKDLSGEAEYGTSAEETTSFEQPAADQTPSFEPASEPAATPSYGEVEVETVSAASEFEYSYSSPETPQEAVEGSKPEEVQPAFAEAAQTQTNGHVEVAETVSQPVAEAAGGTRTKGRFSDRTIDLPIDVPEEERKLHNNARRFARLLVSEIKLYNEQKVIEGREARDLYDRLREAIDRSREMYDKRVESTVSTKFDYFNYELVNSLADGDSGKLGSNYPGSAV